MEKDPEFLLLSNLSKLTNVNPGINQRDISQAVHMSLGMTNSLLKRFSEKGWVLMKKISARNMQYVLTPAGVQELARRSCRYLKRTMRVARDYKDEVSKIIRNAKQNGCTRVLLVGHTDLDFIIEYACSLYALPLDKTDRWEAVQKQDNMLIFYSETEQSSGHISDRGSVNLFDIIPSEAVAVE